MNENQPQQKDVSKSVFKTIAILCALLVVGSTLIYFGGRSDAVSVARSIKSGVLTADEVNVSFQNVGGKLIKHDIQESDFVKKGDTLMVLDPTDIEIAIDSLEAQLAAQKAELAKEKEDYQIAQSETDLNEQSEWRRIEQLKAAADQTKAAMQLAQTEYDRAAKLIKTKSVSQSVVDQASTTLTQAEAADIQAQRQLSTATLGAPEAAMQKLKETGKAEGMPLQSIKNARLKNSNLLNTIAATEAQIKQTESALRQQKVNLERLTLKAPQDGKILKIVYEDGEMINAGAPAVLLETNRKYFDVYVNEEMVNKFKPGTRVKAYSRVLRQFR